MSGPSSNDAQRLKFETPLGEGKVTAIKFSGEEAVNDNFIYRIICFPADNAEINFEEIIGRSCTLKILSDEDEHIFDGICTEIAYAGSQEATHFYEVTLRPWFWLLSQEKSSQIFTDSSVDDVIKAVLDERGRTDYNISINKSYSKIHYCVQYQETAEDFIRRMLEKYGISFYFEPSYGHTMTFFDDNETLKETSPNEAEHKGDISYRSEVVKKIFQYVNLPGSGDESSVLNLRRTHRLRTRDFVLSDYDYENPNTDISGTAKHDRKYPNSDEKGYVYPGGQIDASDASTIVTALKDATILEGDYLSCISNTPTIRAGRRVNIKGHPLEEMNAECVVMKAHHFAYESRFGGNDYDFGNPVARQNFFDPKKDLSFYFSELVLAPKSLRIAPPPRTPSPRIHGAQTARVIGASGEEIDVDEEGRILVQFHWPSYGGDESNSCRVRVAQIWAGNNWGGVWIPRVDQEVVVEFLNGDPDRPLVTGAVYNGENAAPLGLPTDKTQSTIKSQSTTNGTGFNEFRFEDKKGSEEIYTHAERDRVTEILNDDKLTITKNRTVEITEGNEAKTIKQGKGTTEAMQSFEIKVGQSSIKLEPAKITIKSVTVEITADADVKTKGLNATHEGSAMMTIKGGMVHIN